MDIAGGGSVYARFSSASALSLYIEAIGTGCSGGRQGGQAVKVRVTAGGVNLGTIWYLHLANVAVAAGQTHGNGVRLGDTATGLPRDDSCWTGSHVHMEPRNLSGYACYIPLGAGTGVGPGTVIGRMGSVGGTGIRSPCGNAGGGGLPGEGAFVSQQGSPMVYRIAGGAPIYVSNWAVFGGGQPVTVLSPAQFAQLRARPADGTLIATVQDGRVYRVVGGAPVYVSSWNAIGGSQPAMAVDKWAVDNPENPAAHLDRYPADGTLVATFADGRVYRIAGGAPIYVSNWDAIGGPRPATHIDKWAVDVGASDPHSHLLSTPRDGTLISSYADGRVYRIAGGAPIYVSSWDAIGGPQPATPIDKWAIDIGENDPHSHLRRLPADGTLISTSGDGRVYRIAGGAPLYVSNWDAIGGPQPSTRIDKWAVDQAGNPFAHLLAFPLDGTFVNTSTAAVYRFAGGAPFRVSAWGVFGGAQPSTRVDQWPIDAAGDPHSHVRKVPADGTLVRGLPSQQHWRFSGGLRSAASPAAGAVGVDDVGLGAYGQPQPIITVAPTPATTGGAPATPKPPSSKPGQSVRGTSQTSSCRAARSTLTRARKRLDSARRQLAHAKSAHGRRAARKLITRRKVAISRQQKAVRRACG